MRPISAHKRIRAWQTNEARPTQHKSEHADATRSWPWRSRSERRVTSARRSQADAARWCCPYSLLDVETLITKRRTYAFCSRARKVGPPVYRRSYASRAAVPVRWARPSRVLRNLCSRALAGQRPYGQYISSLVHVVHGHANLLPSPRSWRNARSKSPMSLAVSGHLQWQTTSSDLL